MAAIAETTAVEWQEYKDSRFLNALYTLFFWKAPPGFAVLTDGSPDARERRTNEWHERFLMHWIDKLALHGPREAMQYYNAVVGIRDMAIRDVEQRQRDVTAINETAIRQTYASLKLGGRIGVAGVGLAGGLISGPVGWTLTGLALAGNVTFAVVDNWEYSETAKAVVIDPGVERSAAGVAFTAAARGVDNRTLGMQRTAQQSEAEADAVTRRGMEAVERHAQNLKMRLTSSKLQNARKTKIMEKRTLRHLDEIAAQKAAAEAARSSAVTWDVAKKSVHIAGISLAYIFFAYDVRDAIKEYVDATLEPVE